MPRGRRAKWRPRYYRGGIFFTLIRVIFIKAAAAVASGQTVGHKGRAEILSPRRPADARVISNHGACFCLSPLQLCLAMCATVFLLRPPAPAPPCTQTAGPSKISRPATLRKRKRRFYLRAPRASAVAGAGGCASAQIDGRSASERMETKRNGTQRGATKRE